MKNNDAVTDQDTAWLIGAKSKVFGFNLDYNYRDIQRNAVVGALPTRTSPTAPPVRAGIR